MYIKPLKVSFPNGKRINAKIAKYGGKVVIRVDYIKEVEIDNSPFSKKGEIKMTCDTSKYKMVITKLTSYLENLILKGMENENIHTSVRTSNVKGGNASKNSSKQIGTDKGKGNSSSIHSGTGGIKQTKGNTEESYNSIDLEMDEINNTQTVTED